MPECTGNVYSEGCGQTFRLAASQDAEKLAQGRQGYYVMTCPMEKADWVQSTKEVANPYLGQQMPTCGQIKP